MVWPTSTGRPVGQAYSSTAPATGLSATSARRPETIAPGPSSADKAASAAGTETTEASKESARHNCQRRMGAPPGANKPDDSRTALQTSDDANRSNHHAGRGAV